MILTDADWASDSGSADCVHIYHGGHLIEASTSTQQVVSLSTAESEFYGIVRGAASGIQLSEALMQFGFSVRLRVLSDFSAAGPIFSHFFSKETIFLLFSTFFDTSTFFIFSEFFRFFRIFYFETFSKYFFFVC